jgi:hypothetical protein
MDLILLFNFKDVTQREWDSAWNECYHVLENFPVPLGIIHTKQKWGCERKVLSDKILCDEGTKDERFSFRFDMITLEWGGVYELYKDLSHYADKTSENDVLWDDTNKARKYPVNLYRADEINEYNIDCIDECNPLAICPYGTGGAPYTLAVLALGILLENRFPDKCFLWGGSGEQVEKVRIWLSALLKENMNSLICNDLNRLFERLTAIYDTPDLLVRRFWVLSAEGLRETFQFLCEHGYDAELQNEIIHRVKHFSSVAQWGVTDLIYPYLEATQDIEHLIKLVQKIHAINHQEEFSLTELLEDLVDKGIVINPYQNDSETVKEWDNMGKSPKTPVENLNMTMLRMMGLPSRIDFYISADTLIEIFGCTEPANGKKFQEIIERGTKKTKKNYRKLTEATEQLQKKASQENVDDSISYFQTKAALIRRQYLPSEDDILDEVENRATVFHHYKKISLIVGEGLGKHVAKIFKYELDNFLMTTLEDAKKQLTTIIVKKFNLRETAWKAIDNETDMDILKMLIAYAAHPKNELRFCDMRRFVFETPDLWADMRTTFLQNDAKMMNDQCPA